MERRSPAARDVIFYDGHCGLCHRLVRFVLAQDGSGEAFRFAPLDSAAFRAAVPEPERAGLPDSIVVKTAGGRLLVRSAAVLHILERLGGRWRLPGLALRLAPRAVRDFLYDLVARLRRRLFRRPPQVCPAVPDHLLSRFDR